MSAIQYGLTIENERLILAKAEKKKDGVYTFRGCAYRVIKNMVTHIAAEGKIFERSFGFNVVIGAYEGYNSKGFKILEGMK